MTEFIYKYRDILVLTAVWIVSSILLGVSIAAGISILSFLLILNTGNHSKILVAFITVLILSDTRTWSIAFAATAKIGFILLLTLYVVRNHKEFPLGKNYLFRYFLPFFLFVFITLPFSENLFDSFQKSLSYSLLFLVIPPIVFRAFGENESFGKELIQFFALGLFISLITYYLLPNFAFLKGRFRGIFGNPNGLGIYITLILPVIYYLKHHFLTGKKEKFLVYFTLLLVFLNLLLCQSRTALMASLIFVTFTEIKILRGTLGLVLFISIVSAYQLILANLPYIVMSLGLEEYLRTDTLQEASGRLVAWEFAWENIQKNIYIGRGFDYTNFLFHKYADYLSDLGHQGHAHNSYLTLWLDTGIIGLVLFVVGFLRTVFVNLKNNIFILPATYAILFSTNFESWLTASLNPFTIIMVVFLSLSYLEKKEDSKLVTPETAHA